MIAILCTGRTWYSVAPTIRYDLTGKLVPGVAGKDVFLHIAGRWGDAPNTNLEFGGPGLPSVAMNDRRAIATQAAEISADFATFGCDELCAQFLTAHGAGHYTPADPDPDAAYLHRRTVDLSQPGPYVARPGSLSGDHSVPVGEIESRHVDQCFIGSCANGQLEDLRIAAEILDGRQVAPGTRLIVTLASQAVYRGALRLGYVQKIADSGAVVTNSTCGAGRS